MDKAIIQAFKYGGLKRGIKRGLYNAVIPIENRIIRPTPMRLKYFVNKHRLIAKHYQKYWIDQGIGRALDFDNLSNRKSSDTLFILGSGPSINNVSTYQWRVIDQHDSVGLNRWPIHKYVPTFYVFELAKSDSSFNQTLINLIDNKSCDYDDVVMIYKDYSHIYEKTLLNIQIPQWIKDSVMLGVESSFHTLFGWEGSREQNRSLLKHLRNEGYFDEGNIGLLYKKRGSVSFVITLACVLGYSKIVLCGVDMSENIYFWDSPDYDSLRSYIPSSSPLSVRRNTSHATVDSSRGALTLDKIIEDINDVVLKEYDVNLMIEGHNSRLQGVYSEYEW